MATGSGTDWRSILWQLLRPALVAAIVALLVALGVTGLRPPVPAAEPPLVGVRSLTSLSGPLNIAGGIQTGNNLTLTHGSLINSKGAITVTDGLQVTSQIDAGNGVNVTGNITVGTDIDLAGNLLSTSGSVRVNDSTLVTGTLGVSSQLTAGNGVNVSGNISSTGALTVTNWGLFYGLVLAPAATQAITINEAITPTDTSVIYVYTEESDAGVNVNLDGDACIADGTYAGQVLVVVDVDSDAPYIILHCGKNLLCGTDLQLGADGEALTLLWDGSDWIPIAVRTG